MSWATGSKGDLTYVDWTNIKNYGGQKKTKILKIITRDQTYLRITKLEFFSEQA